MHSPVAQLWRESAGRLDAARAALRSAVELSQGAGFVDGVEWGWTKLADLERAAGKIDEAVRLGDAPRQQLQGARPCAYVVTALGNLVDALIQQGDLARAAEVARECYRHVGHRAEESGMWSRLDALALLQAHAGQWTVAAMLAGTADHAYRVRGQHTRQPNEACDRAQLDRLLRQRFAPRRTRGAAAPGAQWSVDHALQVAVRLDPERSNAATPAS